MNGIFNVRKPAGMTSHDVVAAVRRASRQKRVGHAGTLDPAAEGVLLVCVGPATRVVEYLMNGRKRYLATIVLGATTTTDDAEGQVLRRGDVSGITREAVEAALAGFVGRISQVPPMYSALKVGGKPLYKLARAGTEIEREPRQVEVYELRLVEWAPPRLRVDVLCGKGTYIRTLAHDLGERLGCGAYLEHLVRTASGRFSIEEATPLAELVEALADGRWRDLIYPPDVALLDYGVIIVGQEGERRLTTGSHYRPAVVLRRPADQAVCRVYSTAGEPLAVAEYDAADDDWRPTRLLAESRRAGQDAQDA